MSFQSQTTDFVRDDGCPRDPLRALADAGFSHVHWCHQWNSDFLYGPSEITAIRGWLDEFGLKVNDIHGSAGSEKNWGSALDYEREAGIELVRNRVEMAAALGADVVIMHAPREPATDAPQAEIAAFWSRFRRTLDALAPDFRSRGIRLALENMPKDNFPSLRQVWADYPPDYIGLCYDSGHGNMAGNGLDQLDTCKDRLIATHLNDNDGTADQHRPPFTGTVDWPRLAGIIAASGYAKPVMSLEVVIKHSGMTDERRFLHSTREAGERFAAMVKSPS